MCHESWQPSGIAAAAESLSFTAGMSSFRSGGYW
jgi:hypothetical protein